jgi:hypothetical protein
MRPRVRSAAAAPRPWCVQATLPVPVEPAGQCSLANPGFPRRLLFPQAASSRRPRRTNQRTCSRLRWPTSRSWRYCSYSSSAVSCQGIGSIDRLIASSHRFVVPPLLLQGSCRYRTESV